MPKKLSGKKEKCQTIYNVIMTSFLVRGLNKAVDSFLRKSN